MYTLLGKIRTSVYTQLHQSEPAYMSSNTYNFAALPDFRHTQIITYKRIVRVLATRSSPSNHIKISHYDPDPLLDLIH